MTQVLKSGKNSIRDFITSLKKKVLLIDCKGNLVGISNNLISYLGYSELPNNSRLTPSIFFEDQNAFNLLMAEIKKNDCFFSCQVKLKKKSSDLIQVDLISSVFDLEHKHILIQFNDASSFNGNFAFETTKFSFYESVFKKSEEPTLLFNINHVVAYNNSAASLLKISANRSAKLEDFTPANQPNGIKSITKAHEIINKVIKGEEMQFEWLLKTFENELILSEVTLTPLNEIRTGYYRAIVKEVSQKRHSSYKKESFSFSEFVEMSSDAVIILNTSGVILHINKSFEKSSGYTRDNFEGRHISKIPSSIFNNLKYYFDFLTKNLNKELSEPISISWVHKSGQIRTGEIQLKIIESLNEKKLVYGVIKDITSTLFKERKIKENEEKYRKLFEGSRDGIAITTMDGNFLDCNNQFCKMLGYTKTEILKLNYKGITPKKWHIIEAKIVSKELSKRTFTHPYRKEYIKKDNTVIPIEITAYKDTLFNGEEILWGIVRDISDVVNKELKLAKQANDYKRLYEEAPIGRIRSTIDEDIVLLNHRIIKILGFESEERFLTMHKEKGTNYFLPNYDRSDALNKMKNNGENITVEKFIGVNSQKGFVRIRSKFSCSKHRKECYIDSTVEDITDEHSLKKELLRYKDDLENLVLERSKDIVSLNKKLKESNLKLAKTNEGLTKQRDEIDRKLNQLTTRQNKIAHSERMTTIGNIASAIAHEINNPLSYLKNGVLGLESIIKDLVAAYSEFETQCTGQDHIFFENLMSKIKEKYDLVGTLNSIPELTETIHSGVRRTSSIIKNLKEIANISNEVKKVCNLEELINNTINSLKSQTVKFNLYFKGKTIINCYTFMLTQALGKIIANSIESNSTTINIYTYAIRKYNSVLIKIKDSGNGMTEETQKFMFDPFFTTKKSDQHAGIGLTIAYNIINEHNGTISVLSKENKGTTITIKLPF